MDAKDDSDRHLIPEEQANEKSKETVARVDLGVGSQFARVFTQSVTFGIAVAKKLASNGEYTRAKWEAAMLKIVGDHIKPMLNDTWTTIQALFPEGSSIEEIEAVEEQANEKSKETIASVDLGLVGNSIKLGAKTAKVGINLARVLAQNGVYTYDNWRNGMVQALGNDVLPFLDQAWESVKTIIPEGSTSSDIQTNAVEEQANEKTEAENQTKEMDRGLESTPVERKGIMERLRRLPKSVNFFGFGVIFVLLVLALTNPSMSSFKEFLPTKVSDSKINWEKMKCSRTSNWLIFSVYEFKYDGVTDNSGAFWGIFSNFFGK